MKKCILFILFCMLSQLSADDKTVLIAILARNKEHVLPRYLEAIENLDYNKKAISIYINTNNNSDNTESILLDWTNKHKSDYQNIVFDSHMLEETFTDTPHNWTPNRFRALAQIRDKSLLKAKELSCDFYFVADCDNFLKPHTLKFLIEKNKPIIAPLLESIPENGDVYRNFFGDVDETGYYKDTPEYIRFIERKLVGTIKAPVVHCTYLIKTEYIDYLSYIDGTNDYEFIIFSRLARKNGIDQYITNEEEFGCQVHFFTEVSLEEEKRRLNEYFG